MNRVQPSKPVAIASLSLFCLLGCPSKPSDSAVTTASTVDIPKLENPFIKHKNRYSGTSNDGLSEETLGSLDATDGIPLDLKDQCTKQICGDPNQTPGPSDILYGNIEIPEDADRVFQDIKPSLDHIFDARTEFRKQLIAKIERALSRLASLNIADKYTAIINLSWLISKQGMFAPAMNRSQDGKYAFDEAILTRLTPKMSAQERESLKTMASDLYNSTELQTTQQINQVGLTTFLMSHYPGSTLPAAESAFATPLLNAYPGLETDFPELELRPPPELKIMAEGGSLTPTFADAVNRSLLVAYVARILSGDLSAYTQRQVPVKGIVNYTKNHKILEQRLSYLNNTQQIEQKREQGMNACRITLGRSLLAAPERKEIAAAALLIARIKGVLNKMTAHLTSDPGAQSRILNKIQNVDFDFPMDRFQTASAVRASAYDSDRENDNSLRSLVTLNDNALFLLLYQFDAGSEASLSDEISSRCDVFSPSELFDNRPESTDKITLSWQAVRYPNYGAGLIAHDFGHVISTLLSQEPAASEGEFVSLRSCTNERHGHLSREQNAIYEEEDFADLIGARVVGEMQSQGLAVDNFGCLLLEHNSTRWGTAHGLTLFAASDNKEDHSTDLFRTLQIQIDSGQPLPNICEQVIETYQPSLNQSCTE